jgi:cell division protein FtsZ
MVIEINMIEFEKEEFEDLAHIKVIGVGGGGSNAVKRMIEAELTGVEFYVVNTDLQALRTCHNTTRVQIGINTTSGLGAGADPEKGRKAAEEDKDKLKSIVEGADMVFVTAGMGGGTGTGAAPVIASLAKESGALTIGVMTRPFDFEGKKRAIQAEEGLQNVQECADSVIVIPNQRLMEYVDRKLPIRLAFRMGDQILLHAVQSISDLITVPGEINLDFADVKTIMSDSGGALMGIGFASGDNRAEIAAKNSISSPLLEESSIEGASGIIVNITGPSDMMMHELEGAMDVIRGASDTDQLIFGLAYNDDLEDELRVTVIATGFDSNTQTTNPISGSGEVMNIEEILGRRFVGTQTGQQGRSSKTTTGGGEESEGSDNTEDQWDVPTFVRLRGSKDKK